MRSLADMAVECILRYPSTPQRRLSEAAWHSYLRSTWYEFANRCHGLYRPAALETPFVIGQRAYSLPSDYKEPLRVYLSYTPRVIASVSRASNVLTVNTTLAHSLAVGMQVALDEVTGVGGTTFDGTVTVATTPLTTRFTATQADDDDTGTVTTDSVVRSTQEAVDVTVRWESSLKPLPSWDATDAQPQYAYFTKRGQIAFDPPPDGAIPAWFLEYEGQPPSTLTVTETLPADEFAAGGIMAYAAAQAGLADLKTGVALFEQAVRLQRAAISKQFASNDASAAEEAA